MVLRRIEEFLKLRICNRIFVDEEAGYLQVVLVRDAAVSLPTDTENRPHRVPALDLDPLHFEWNCVAGIFTMPGGDMLAGFVEEISTIFCGSTFHSFEKLRGERSSALSSRSAVSATQDPALVLPRSRQTHSPQSGT